MIDAKTQESIANHEVHEAIAKAVLDACILVLRDHALEQYESRTNGGEISARVTVENAKLLGTLRESIIEEATGKCVTIAGK